MSLNAAFHSKFRLASHSPQYMTVISGRWVLRKVNLQYMSKKVTVFVPFHLVRANGSGYNAVLLCRVDAYHALLYRTMYRTVVLYYSTVHVLSSKHTPEIVSTLHCEFLLACIMISHLNLLIALLKQKDLTPKRISA